ncbi:hypothetical protein C8J56DRAFT_896147 [Mycena floridula]|nr:hypothetical protein C8J56DRAFT_896147 [Mycena floridula]
MPPINLTDAQSALQEKARLRRAYEAQDAAAAGKGGFPNNSGGMTEWKTWKRVAWSNGNGRAGNGSKGPETRDKQVSAVEPDSCLLCQPMTAAEEKALLGAKFGVTPSANEINGEINGTGTKVPTTPPPLMPCPPVSYIQEMREEDARVSRMVLADAFVPLGDSGFSPDDGKRFPREDLKRGSSLNGVTEEGYGGEEVNGTGLETPGPPKPVE